MTVFAVMAIGPIITAVMFLCLQILMQIGGLTRVAIGFTRLNSAGCGSLLSALDGPLITMAVGAMPETLAGIGFQVDVGHLHG